jgi:hypothetical protein
VRVYQFRHIRVAEARRYRTLRRARQPVATAARAPMTGGQSASRGLLSGPQDRTHTALLGRTQRAALIASTGLFAPPSSRGLGRRPLTAVTRVRIPLAVSVRPRFYWAFCFPGASLCQHARPAAAPGALVAGELAWHGGRRGSMATSIGARPRRRVRNLNKLQGNDLGPVRVVRV